MEREVSLIIRQGFASRIILCLLLFFFGGKALMAEETLLKSEYSYRKYTVHDGLPEGLCTRLYQDSKGFIWVGTTNGFARYDSYTFHPYHTESDNLIWGFFEDSKGNVSGISLNQLYQVSFGSDTVHSHEMVTSPKEQYAGFNSISMPVGYGIFQIGNAKVVYAIADSGLVKIWEHEKLNKVQESLKPYWDKSGKRFFIPTYNGAYVINENGVVTDSFTVKTMNCFIPYKGGFLAVADDGLYEYDNRELKQILKYPFFKGNLKDYSILEDAAGNYIIRAENTIYRYADNQLETIASNLPQTHDMCFDREGIGRNKWRCHY